MLLGLAALDLAISASTSSMLGHLISKAWIKLKSSGEKLTRSARSISLSSKLLPELLGPTNMVVPSAGTVNIGVSVNFSVRDLNILHRFLIDARLGWSSRICTVRSVIRRGRECERLAIRRLS